MSRNVMILFLFVLIPVILDAQSQSRWKRMRYEIFYGIGATNFLGELGGADREGTNFVRDLEIAMTRPSTHLGLRYRITETVSSKAMLSYGILRGDDKLTNEVYRRYRNLAFRSPIVEFSNQIEYSIIREKQGHRYNLRRVRGLKGFKTNTYFFVGFGVIYFNPKNKYQGKWYALQPLGTEGQGLVPTRTKYSRINFCIPYGIGFKYGLNRRTNIGIEFGARKTFTDYIDDVSTTYFDNQMIREARGDIAAYFADPSDGT
ncbi:MAG: DUF6089 family protein, partial [Bacteroidales bacterium]|nr:DUF6089 family protein [Bacteroidales bacterium]